MQESREDKIPQERIQGEEKLQIKRELEEISAGLCDLYAKNIGSGWTKELKDRRNSLVEKRDKLARRLARILGSKLFPILDSDDRFIVFHTTMKEHILEEPAIFIEVLDTSKQSLKQLKQDLAKHGINFSFRGGRAIKDAPLTAKKECEEGEFEKLVRSYGNL